MIENTYALDSIANKTPRKTNKQQQVKTKA